MTVYYLDTSVAAQVLLGHSPDAAAWMDAVNADPASSMISSRLLRTELTRMLRREQLPVRMRDELLDHLGTVPLTGAVLAEAEAIVPHLKTLDAIHLASVISTGLDAVVATHDTVMRKVAETVGYPTVDPVAGSVPTG